VANSLQSPEPRPAPGKDVAPSWGTPENGPPAIPGHPETALENGPPPHRPSTKGRARIVFALVLVGLVGVCGGFLALWVTDVAAPTRTYSAVISDVQEFVTHDEAGTFRTTRNTAALGDDGRTIDLLRTTVPGGPAYGDPLVLRLSEWTGRVAGARTAAQEARNALQPFTVALVVLSCLVLAVSALSRSRSLWTMAPRGLTAAVVALAVLVVGAVESRSPYREPSRFPLTDEFGMGVYGRTILKSLPPIAMPPVVEAGGDARLDAVTLRVTGPVATIPPAGAPGWLRDFHVITIPVLATAPPPANPSVFPGYVPLELIGRGTGDAVLVQSPACGGVPQAFDGRFPLGVLRFEGPVCFVVPKDFQPLYLVAGVGESASALSLSR